MTLDHLFRFIEGLPGPGKAKRSAEPDQAPSLAAMIEPKYNHCKRWNFDVKTEEGFDMAMRLGEVGIPKLSQLDGEAFELVYWAAEGSLYNGEDDDEPREGVRLALWDKDGVMFRTTSMGVIRQLDRIIAFRGEGPYDPPMKLRITPAETSGGRRTYNVAIWRD